MRGWLKTLSIGCVEFEGGRREMVEKIGGIVGAEEWNGVERDGRVLLLLGKKVMVRWEWKRIGMWVWVR